MTASLRALLSEVVDYAGFFPPAGLELASALQRYAEYLEGPRAWMLGRLVVPVSAIDEVRERSAGRRMWPWRLSAVAGDDALTALDAVADFNARGDSIAVDMVEVRASDGGAIAAIAGRVPARTRVFVEIPCEPDPSPLVRAIAAARLRAKIRTGGITPDAFPPAGRVARFVRACYAAGVAFKATAGLHHPLRAEQALTYEPDAERGVMHGFLNVLLTAAFCYNGLTAGDAERLMELGGAGDLRFDDDGVAWEQYRVSTAEIETARRRLAISFGSCSFEEPVGDLEALKLL